MATLGGPLGSLLRGAAVSATALALIAVELAPLPGRVSPALTPDLLACFLAALILSRPGAAPPALVFALGLARDLLGGGPAGAGALGLLGGMTALERAAPALRRRGFLVRWSAAIAAAAVAALTPPILLTLAFAEAPALTDLGLRVAATALVFPVIALAIRIAPRIGPADPVATGQAMFARRAL